MPKREPESDTTSSTSPSPKKAKSTASNPKKKWSNREETLFLEAIDRLVKAGLWNEVKGNELAERGANGVRSHWDAMYKKLKKG